MYEDSENGVVDLGKLHSYNDPFTPRTGKTLTWRDVNMIVVSFLCINTPFHIILLKKKCCCRKRKERKK